MFQSGLAIPDGFLQSQALSFRPTTNLIVFQIATVALTHIAKIISGSLEVNMCEAYNNEIHTAYKDLSDRYIRRAILFGICSALPFYVYAFLIYYGGLKLRAGEIEFENLFK